MNSTIIEKMTCADLVAEAREVEQLYAEITKLQRWNADMVKKAASGGTLEGYREMASQLTEKDAEITKLTAEGAKHVDEINHLWEETDKLRAENDSLSNEVRRLMNIVDLKVWEKT